MTFAIETTYKPERPFLQGFFFEEKSETAFFLSKERRKRIMEVPLTEKLTEFRDILNRKILYDGRALDLETYSDYVLPIFFDIQSSILKDPSMPYDLIPQLIQLHCLVINIREKIKIPPVEK